MKQYPRLTQILKRGLAAGLALAVALAVLPAVSFAAEAAVNAPANPAVSRAVAYGIVPDALQSRYQSTMLYSEFCALMRSIVEKINRDELAAWDQYAGAAQKSSREMCVGDVYALAYYVGCLSDQGVTSNGDWMSIFDSGHNTQWEWMDAIQSWDILSDAGEPSPFKDNVENPDPAGWDYVTAGYFWCMGQFSKFENEPVLDADDAALVTGLTREEGIAIAARLYESLVSAADTENCEEARAILANAQAWKTEFFNTAPTAEGTGKTFYISNSGSDASSGTSPEKAWATLERIESADLQPGDVVLLERGGTWYRAPSEEWGLTSGAVILQEGVTLGAYGEGARPVIRGDIAGASEPENWQLWYEQDGVRIWKYGKDVRDCPVVVFNQGEAYAEIVIPYWNGTEYVCQDGSAFDVTEALNRDLAFCQLLNLDGDSDTAAIGDGTYTGPLYLRCDAGNPAEVYPEIAIPQNPCGFCQQSDSTLNGLDIRYFTCIATTLDTYDGNTGMALLHCEISWCGGMMDGYQQTDMLPDGVCCQYRAGGAVQCSGTDITVSGNYIHDCGPMACIISIHGDEAKLYIYQNILIENNIIERCGTALHWAGLSKMDNPESDGFISNLEFSDNMVLYAGTGWILNMVNGIFGDYELFLSGTEDLMGAINNDGILIADNVFYLCSHAMVQYRDALFESQGTVNQPPVFSGNVYAQHRFGWLAKWNGMLMTVSQDTVGTVLGDETGTAVEID